MLYKQLTTEINNELWLDYYLRLIINQISTMKPLCVIQGYTNITQ